MPKHSLKFWIGVVFLIINIPLGYGGFALAFYLVAKTGNKSYLALGGIIYGLSWGLLFLGAYLAGPEGVTLVKNTWRKIFKRKEGKKPE
ncbi:MAG: hypothetical protein V1653_00230 [bacterium]